LVSKTDKGKRKMKKKEEEKEEKEEGERVGQNPNSRLISNVESIMVQRA
jgi:hypothetical protein